MNSLLHWFRSLNVGGKPTRPRAKRTSLTIESLERRELMAVLADLQAYRPVTDNVDYSQFAVPDAVETDLQKGPGIRINGDDDNRNGKPDRLDKNFLFAVDDDLVRVDVKSSAQSNILTWTGNLSVWKSQSKFGQPLVNGQNVSPGAQLWVEYVGTNHSVGANTTLMLTSKEHTSTMTDQIVFHTFKSDVLAFGGFFQDTRDEKGPFAIAKELYQRGYDTHIFSDRAVDLTGKGSAYNEVSSAIRDRGVTNLAMFGYSYGGGAVNDLATALDSTPQLKGRYALQYSAYIDAIQHYSLVASSETRRPVGSQFHDNIFERNDTKKLFGIAVIGNFVPGANTNINVSVNNPKIFKVFKANLDHWSIDDYKPVQDTISNSLQSHVVVR